MDCTNILVADNMSKNQDIVSNSYRTMMKTDFSDSVNVLKKDISGKPDTVRRMHFSKIVIHGTFQLDILIFFQQFLWVNSRKRLSVCMCFISFVRDSCTVLRDQKLCLKIFLERSF